jgi:hypothetical protein
MDDMAGTPLAATLVSKAERSAWLEQGLCLSAPQYRERSCFDAPLTRKGSYNDLCGFQHPTVDPPENWQDIVEMGHGFTLRSGREGLQDVM